MDFFSVYNFFKGFRFESPWFLLLLIPLIMLFVLALVRKQPSLSVPWIKPFILSKNRKSFRKNNIATILYFLAALLMIISLARPQKGLERLKQRAKGIDIMLALDLSGSMKAIDIPNNLTKPQIVNKINNGSLKSRISYAKDEIRMFIKKRPNDRIGLVVFAPLPYVACPPTLDHSWLLLHLNKVDAGIIGDSTNIAAPITSAVNRLKNTESKRKVLVLFTDGSNNVEDRINPLQAAKLAKMYNVIIYTVGIGSPNAYVLQNSVFGAQFIPVAGQFDDKLLKKIAKITKGKYYSVKDGKGLQKVLDKIDKLEKTTVETPIFTDYKELGPQILIAALIFFIMGVAADKILFVKIP
ncbi:MAG: VWA domain-containing protein [Victivallales bacterium]|nr:VWA domain-containing protein [Victivallales bacterium]